MAKIRQRPRCKDRVQGFPSPTIVKVKQTMVTDRVITPLVGLNSQSESGPDIAYGMLLADRRTAT
jgi:hypothetical protein